MITPITYTKNTAVHGITLHFAYCPERHRALALAERAERVGNSESDRESVGLYVCPLGFNETEPYSAEAFNRLHWMPFWYDSEKRQHGTSEDARREWAKFLEGV